MQLITNGIVLRDYKLEEDRLITILTEEHGVLSAYANNARRPRSKLAASTELLCYSNFTLFSHRDRFTVDNADCQRIFTDIRSDIEKLALACYFAELTSQLAPREEPAGTYLRLLLNTLHMLDTGARSNAQLKATYELRLLTLAGYMPDLVACRQCATYESDKMLFFPGDGTLCCSNCLDGSAGGVSVSPGVLAAMRHITFSETNRLFSFNLAGKSLDILGRICEDYLKFQIERTFPTLEFYHSILIQ